MGGSLALLATLLKRMKCGCWALLWCSLGSIPPYAVSAQVYPQVMAPEPAQTQSPLNGQYLKTRWTTENGLPQNTITSIVQTRDGYLWLATFGGLVRFDGARFTIFNLVNTPQLKSNRITALLEDRDGSLWIGAETGEIMRYRQGEFTSWPGVGGHIMEFYQDRQRLIWGTRPGGRPIRFAPEHPDQVAIVSAAQGLASERMYSICEDRTGQLWATTRQGVTVWRDGAFRPFSEITGLPEGGVPKVLPHADNGMWVVAERGLGHLINNQTGQTSEQTIKPTFKLLISPPDHLGLPPPPLIETRSGEVWFGYREDCLWRGNRAGEFSEMKLEDATHNYLRALLEDREGNIWLGTSGSGLVRLRPKRVTTLSKADGLPSNEVFCIGEDGQGNAWVGTQPGMICLAAGKITAWSEADLRKQINVPSPATFYRDQAGTLWLGGDGYLAQVRDGQLAVQQLKDFPYRVGAILADHRGQLWLGSENDGLALMHHGVVTKVYRVGDGLVNDRVRVLLEDHAGALWIGAVGGLSRFKDGVFTNWTINNGLSNDTVRALYEDQDGALWIGTYGGGLNRLKDGRLTQITTKHGLFDDVVSRLLVDDRDRFWMLGNHGLFFVSRQQLNDFAAGRIKSVMCSSYGLVDGMLSSEGNGINQPAGWRMRDGRMWFPTIKGIVIVDPRQPLDQPPPVVIEEVQLDHAAVDLRQTIKLVPGHENLEIHYTGLHFGKPEQVRFKYKLEGLDTDWTDVGTRRAAYYTHLPPGTYTFHVLAANPDGVWSEASARLSLVVYPPFYRTWWFGSLAVFSAGLLALAAYRTRIAQLERRHRKEQALSRKLIDSQERERQRIAAELHDSLGQSLVVIKNRARLGLKQSLDAEAMSDQLEIISTAASLALDEVKEISFNLRPYVLDKLGLTRAIESMLEKVFGSGEVALELELDTIDNLLPKEAEILLYRVVQECVNNIVKHAHATHARVRIKHHGHSLTLTIEDNGCGFDPAAIPDPAKRSFGLMGIAERARLLGGKHAIVSETGHGTTVTVQIDLSHETHHTTLARAHRG